MGDDDQNIYDFGGANGDFIREFKSHFPGSEISELTRNYRSSGAILAVAGEIVAPVADRMKQGMIAIDPARAEDPPQGAYFREEDPSLGLVEVVAAAGRDIRAQAAAAVERLELLARRVGEPRWNWDSTAVLVRRQAHVRIVEAQLSAAGIPVSRDFKGLLSLLRVREAAWTQTRLRRLRDRDGWISAEILIALAEELAQAHGGFWSEILGRRLRIMAAQMGPEGASAFEALDEFIEWASVWKGEQTGVRVLTAHRAKGLEFDNVVVCDAEWGGFQGGLMPDSEWRLFYVAATRARHALSLVTSEGNRRSPLCARLGREGTVDLASGAQPRSHGATTLFEPCSLRDVYLSYPARGRNFAAKGEAILRARTGDPLILKPPGPKDKRWAVALKDGAGPPVGEMSTAFGKRFRSAAPQARIFAVVYRRRIDSQDEGYRHLDQQDVWWTIVPEIALNHRS